MTEYVTHIVVSGKRTSYTTWREAYAERDRADERIASEKVRAGFERANATRATRPRRGQSIESIGEYEVATVRRAMARKRG